MAQVAKIWENLFLGIRHQIPLPSGYRTIKTWDIGGKVIAGQVYNQKILKNENIQKRITTVFFDSKIGLETEVYSPSGELLKSYAGIRTTGRTKPLPAIENGRKEVNIAEEMLKAENLKGAKTLSNIQ